MYTTHSASQRRQGVGFHDPINHRPTTANRYPSLSDRRGGGNSGSGRSPAGGNTSGNSSATAINRALARGVRGSPVSFHGSESQLYAHPNGWHSDTKAWENLGKTFFTPLRSQDDYTSWQKAALGFVAALGIPDVLCTHAFRQSGSSTAEDQLLAENNASGTPSGTTPAGGSSSGNFSGRNSSGNSSGRAESTLKVESSTSLTGDARVRYENEAKMGSSEAAPRPPPPMLERQDPTQSEDWDELEED